LWIAFIFQIKYDCGIQYIKKIKVGLLSLKQDGEGNIFFSTCYNTHSLPSIPLKNKLEISEEL
jgi:hypothetical protein